MTKKTKKELKKITCFNLFINCCDLNCKFLKIKVLDLKFCDGLNYDENE